MFITLTSDFGLKDPYVGEMKAVILSICPKATIVDITHGISRFNVREGALVLARATRYFPKGTIHVAVVDPGVGTERKAIVVEARRHIYVGPDNGLLFLSASREGIKNVYHIVNKKYTLAKISRTFWGRDVFAPVAAHLARGIKPSELGPRIVDYQMPTFTKPKIERGVIRGEVLYIDHFGNVVTNISEELLERVKVDENALNLRVGSRKAKVRLCEAYGGVPIGKPLLIVGSGGFLEVSVNQGSAARLFKVNVGDEVELRLHP
jgi:hypothetical protein